MARKAWSLLTARCPGPPRRGEKVCLLKANRSPLWAGRCASSTRCVLGLAGCRGIQLTGPRLVGSRSARMAKSDYDREVRECVERFVAEMSELVRRAALESVNEAMGGPAPKRAPKATPKRAKAKRAAKAAPAKKTSKGAGVVKSRRATGRASKKKAKGKKK